MSACVPSSVNGCAPAVTTKPTDFFFPNPKQPRKFFPDEELRLLGESMLAQTQIVPGIALETGMIVDMERRWRAAQLVGLKTLNAYLLPADATPKQIAEISLVTSLHRADLSAYEQYCGFKTWLEINQGASGKQLATAIKCSEGLVSMTLSLDKNIEAVKDAAAAGKIVMKDWYAWSRLRPEQQAAKLAAKLSGHKPEGEHETVKVDRISCDIPGKAAKLTIAGKNLSLAAAIEIVQDWLKLARKAADDGISAASFVKVCKDKAKGS